MPLPVTAIFDIGKTNKKLLLFDSRYRLADARTVQLAETTDEDGFACEDLAGLTRWMRDSLREVARNPDLELCGLNVSAYGASLVYLDGSGAVMAPLYNYLKPYPEALQQRFYATYGSPGELALQTASPALGSLNAGLQLYRFKQEQPARFAQMACAMHLPQYLACLFTGERCSDLTSLGCHTALWDFRQGRYHDWVLQEGLDSRLAPLCPPGSQTTTLIEGRLVAAGTGLHDSSAALIPYLVGMTEPFLLVSTGTWCISLNPFNEEPLTREELEQDCLCYLSYTGKPVKAARLFAGPVHDRQVAALAAHFDKNPDYFRGVRYNPALAARLATRRDTGQTPGLSPLEIPFRQPHDFSSFEEGYHQLMRDITGCQAASLRLALGASGVRHVCVDGGFSGNALFMEMLAASLPDLEVYAAEVPQASALGAALAVRLLPEAAPLPGNLVSLRRYPAINPMET